MIIISFWRFTMKTASFHLGTQSLKQDQQERLDDFFLQLQDEADHFWLPMYT